MEHGPPAVAIRITTPISSIPTHPKVSEAILYGTVTALYIHRIPYRASMPSRFALRVCIACIDCLLMLQLQIDEVISPRNPQMSPTRVGRTMARGARLGHMNLKP